MSHDSNLVQKRKSGLRKHVHGIAKCVLVSVLPGAIFHGIMKTGAQTFVLKGRFVFGIVLVVDVDGNLGSARWGEGVVVVEMGVVVVD